MTDLKKEIKYLPVFIALTCIYFSEVFLRGAVLAIGDGFDYSYPLMIEISNQYKDITFPFWNPYMFSGFPLFGSMQAGALYPFNIVLPLVFSPTLAFNLNLILHYSLAGFFAFLYSRQIGLGAFPSLVAGTVFSLLGYLPAHLQHPTLITSAAWIPFILYFYERLRQDLQGKNALYGAIIIAVQIFSGGHPQICFYTYLLLAFYVVFHLFYLDRSRRLRFAFLSILPLGLGILIALPQIVATYELATMAARVKTTYEFFSSYAFSVHMITSFLFPFFYYHGGNNGEYWGPVPDLGVEAFVGTFPFLLALLVMTRWKKSPHILFWGILAVLAFVLSVGDALRPLNKLLFYLPGYNSFRGLSKHILEVSLALSILTGFGMSFLLDRERERRFRIELVIVLSSVIAVSLTSFIFFDAEIRDFFKETFSTMDNLMLRWNRNNIPEKALSIADPAVYVPMLTMTSYLVCILVFLKTSLSPLSPHFGGGKQKESPRPLWERVRVMGSFQKYLRHACLAAIFMVLFAEALIYKIGDIPDADTLHKYNRDLYTTLASAPDPGSRDRTIFFTPQVSILTAIPYGIRLAEGYDPLEIGDYKKVLPTMSNLTPEICRAVIRNNSILGMMSARYLVVDNVLGDAGDVRWYIARDGKGKWFPLPPVAKRPPNAELIPIYRKIASFPSFSLYENTIALPRARSVSNLKPLNSIDDLVQMLFSYQLNPWSEAALSMDDLRKIGADSFSPGEVSISEDRPDRVTISTSFRGTGFVVLADQFYPGWEAYIDGKRTEIYKTNGVQRGVVVLEGEHTLVVKYVPRLIYASMVLSGILLAGILFVLLQRRPREK